jgi:hypothetical protein
MALVLASVLVEKRGKLKFQLQKRQGINFRFGLVFLKFNKVGFSKSKGNHFSLTNYP